MRTKSNDRLNMVTLKAAKTGNQTETKVEGSRSGLCRQRSSDSEAREATFRGLPDREEAMGVHSDERSGIMFVPVQVAPETPSDEWHRRGPRPAERLEYSVRCSATASMRRCVESTFRPFSGRSVQEIFTGITEVVCQDGGSIDEAIARDAWLETVAELDQIGIDNLDAVTDEQIQELFLSFVAHSIEARLYQEDRRQWLQTVR